MNVLQDLRFALRQLRRAPGFAVTAVLTLALGIGANTAIFSLLDQALLRSLPVRDPKSLVVLKGTGDVWEGHTSTHGGGVEAYFSYPMYKDLRDHNQAFEGMIATAPADIGFVYRNAPQSARAEIVSGNYFTLLGVKPALGRLFTQAEDQQKDANPIAVLSFDFWRDHLGADPAIVGTTVAINGHPFQIVGVAAQGFRSAIWGEIPGVFAPMSMLGQVLPSKGKSDKRLIDHTDRWMNILARLKPGENRTEAEAAIAPLWHALRADELRALGKPANDKHFVAEFSTHSRLLVVPGARGFSYNRSLYQQPLLIVTAMAALILLIAAINVASLLLVRAAGRMHEFSLRYALGAGGTRILLQLVLEGLLIGMAGSVAAMLLAPVVLRTLVQRLNGDQAYGSFASSIDSRVLLFNFAITLGVTLLFSLAPALQLRRLDLNRATRQQSGTGSGAVLTFRRVIVSLQIGLSVILLIGAGLFVRTMQNLRRVNVGFNTSYLVTFAISPKLSGYQPVVVPAMTKRIANMLAVVPGVQSVAVTDDAELAGDHQGGNVSVSGPNAPSEDDFDVEEPFVSQKYFATMQVPLLAGRVFLDSDGPDHPPVAIVNESFAKHFCGSVQGCVGRFISNAGGKKSNLDLQIVGVVRDAKHGHVRDAVSATSFRPLTQSDGRSNLFFYLRTATPPAQMLPTIRRAMQQFDSTLALTALRTMDQQIEDDLANERLVSLLAVAFGMLATLLAGVGIYGVLAYSTAQRTREMGIRIALGSSRAVIARIILADVLRLAFFGALIGAPAGIVLTRFARSQLFGVSANDPLTLVSVVLLIAMVAVLAAVIPARRAASVEPSIALRSE